MEQFVVNARSGKTIDKVPNRHSKSWFYLNKQVSNKDAFIIISREKICQDLDIKDCTLADYVSGTFNFQHLWEKEGNFQSFSTIYGGNIMVIFFGLKEKDGHLQQKFNRLRGSLLDNVGNDSQCKEPEED